MMLNGLEVFLYSPYEMKRATPEEIEQEVNRLKGKYIQDAVSMWDISTNIEILANINSLYGAMISRLKQAYIFKKNEVDRKIKINMVSLRQNWNRENPKEKAPAISYFEAQAELLEEEGIKAYIQLNTDLDLFKLAYDSMAERINALKRKQDAIKYEDFGDSK